MKITIIGASAGVGLLCVKQALDRNHQVTALSRNLAPLPKHPGLTAIKGSATNAADVKDAIKNAEAVIVAIGTGTSTKATTLYSDASAALITAQQELRTKVPFIVLTGFGASDSGKYHGFILKLLFFFILKAVYKDKTKMEEMIAASKMNWEIVRPGVLTDKPLSGVYRVETDYHKGMNIGQISRADVADFMIKQAENPTELGKYPALSNK